MKHTVFVAFNGTRNSYTNMSLTKLGHTDYNIDKIHTIRDLTNESGTSYVVVECFKAPTDEQISSLKKNIDKFLQVESVKTNDNELNVLFLRAKNKEEGTKRKFWFEHATYVSPGLANKD
jgi:hypothetical protein